jgi:L-2-hydroxyglutarate oxidase LhgO
VERVETVVVGAGVIGLAVAKRLAEDGRELVVVETNPRYGMETSSRNSEVVHAGIYYPKDSLKSRLCHAGRELLYRKCPEWGVFIKKTGKMIVASEASEVPALEALLKKAADAGAQGLELRDGAWAKSRVPGLKAEAAVWSPETGIISSDELMDALKARAEDRGAALLLKTALAGAERVPDGYVLRLSTGERVHAASVVNAAGLFGDKVAAMPAPSELRLRWCKGSYFRLKKKLEIPCLVYPMPVAHGLGVHLTLDQQGEVRLGPDTEFVDALDYAVDASRAESFARAASRYLPGLRADDLRPDTAGIRPKLAPADGKFQDFVVAEQSARGLPRWIDLCGIESPGLTASLAIADEVAKMLS